jgi:hypothetical protein
MKKIIDFISILKNKKITSDVTSDFLKHNQHHFYSIFILQQLHHFQSHFQILPTPFLNLYPSQGILLY